MSRNLTASDRKNLIRIASEMPKGSPERRAILAGLVKSAKTYTKVIPSGRYDYQVDLTPAQMTALRMMPGGKGLSYLVRNGLLQTVSWSTSRSFEPYKMIKKLEGAGFRQTTSGGGAVSDGSSMGDSWRFSDSEGNTISVSSGVTSYGPRSSATLTFRSPIPAIRL